MDTAGLPDVLHRELQQCRGQCAASGYESVDIPADRARSVDGLPATDSVPGHAVLGLLRVAHGPDMDQYSAAGAGDGDPVGSDGLGVEKQLRVGCGGRVVLPDPDRKSTRLNSSHRCISY